LADVEEVNGVVVAWLVHESVVDVGVLPRLGDLWECQYMQIVRYGNSLLESHTDP
jgi:hypothetical protein